MWLAVVHETFREPVGRRTGVINLRHAIQLLPGVMRLGLPVSFAAFK